MNTETSSIEQKEDDLAKAMLRSDVSALDALLHDNLVFHLPDGRRIVKQQDLEAYAQGHMQMDTIQFLTRTIDVAQNTAVVSAEVAIAGKANSVPFEGNFRFLRVWKKEGTTWKILAGSSTALDPIN